MLDFAENYYKAPALVLKLVHHFTQTSQSGLSGHGRPSVIFVVPGLCLVSNLFA